MRRGASFDTLVFGRKDRLFSTFSLSILVHIDALSYKFAPSFQCRRFLLVICACGNLLCKNFSNAKVGYFMFFWWSSSGSFLSAAAGIYAMDGWDLAQVCYIHMGKQLWTSTCRQWIWAYASCLVGLAPNRRRPVLDEQILLLTFRSM